MAVNRRSKNFLKKLGRETLLSNKFHNLYHEEFLLRIGEVIFYRILDSAFNRLSKEEMRELEELIASNNKKAEEEIMWEFFKSKISTFDIIVTIEKREFKKEFSNFIQKKLEASFSKISGAYFIFSD